MYLFRPIFYFVSQLWHQGRIYFFSPRIISANNAACTYALPFDSLLLISDPFTFISFWMVQPLVVMAAMFTVWYYLFYNE